jgi:hypothetical protein
VSKLCVADEQAVGKVQTWTAAHNYPQRYTNAPQVFPRLIAAQGAGAKGFSDLSRVAASLISYY